MVGDLEVVQRNVYYMAAVDPQRNRYVTGNKLLVECKVT